MQIKHVIGMIINFLQWPDPWQPAHNLPCYGWGHFHACGCVASDLLDHIFSHATVLLIRMLCNLVRDIYSQV